MIHTLVLLGHMPSKKNNLRPRFGKGRGLMNSREVTAIIQGFEIQARAAWRGKPTIERAKISATFCVPNGFGDLDGKYTTLQDVLVKAGVIRNDTIARVPAHMVDHVIGDDEGVSVEILDLGPALSLAKRKAASRDENRRE